MPKAVAVIILNYNTPVHTAACVGSLMEHCNQQVLDVIVADNGSTDGSLAILERQFPEVFFIDNKENLGFAEGNNKALQYSIINNYEYSLLINSDTIVESDIITILKECLDKNTKLAAVQPAIYWMHDKGILWNGPGSFNHITGNVISKTAGRYQTTGKPLNVKWVSGCCAMFRNSALQSTGLFNGRFFMYYEDADLSFRLRSNNYELEYVAIAKIYHEAGVSGKSSGKEGVLNPVIHYYYSRNHLWFIRRYVSKPLIPIAMAYNLGYYLLLWLYFKLRNKKQKASFLSRGLAEGINTPLNLIW